jgi:vancomycin aglycone glucosyltransferase
MRVLLSTIGSRGDVQPLVALALALRTLGHDAHFCVPPDFREWIDGLGFPVTPVGPEVKGFAVAPAASSAGSTEPAGSKAPAYERREGPARETMSAERIVEKRRQMMEATVTTQFEALGSAVTSCDAIVAATALQIAARSVAEKKGIPYFFAAYTPTVLPSAHHAPIPMPPLPGETPSPATDDNRELWARNAARFHDLFGDALNARRASIGLAPVDDVRGHMFTGTPWLAADPVLGPWPDPAREPIEQTGVWILQDNRPLTRELEAFLDAGEPPIYFGFGSSRTTLDLNRVMIQSARALGRRAIVSRGWADLSPIDDRSDCLAIDDTNLRALFPRVAAIVHHGGAGTTTLASLSGAPQVVMPQHYDQHYWAGRVEQLGIGVAHARGAPITESLTCALAKTLEPAVAARARAVASAVRLDGADVAARKVIAAM